MILYWTFEAAWNLPQNMQSISEMAVWHPLRSVTRRFLALNTNSITNCMKDVFGCFVLYDKPTAQVTIIVKRPWRWADSHITVQSLEPIRTEAYHHQAGSLDVWAGSGICFRATEHDALWFVASTAILSGSRHTPWWNTLASSLHHCIIMPIGKCLGWVSMPAHMQSTCPTDD